MTESFLNLVIPSVVAVILIALVFVIKALLRQFKYLLVLSTADILMIKQARVKDPLTGLYNRGILLNKDSEWSCCLYLDLDKLKQINEIYGYPTGDFILAEVGKILSQIADEVGGMAIREGKDRFLLLLNHAEDYTIAIRCLNEIKSIKLNSKEFSIGAFIGIACGDIAYFNDYEDQLGKLILASESAARKIKKSSKSDSTRDRILVWSKALAEEEKESYFIELSLKNQSINDQLWLAYQPIVNMETGKILGAEALLRWQSPELGSVPPTKFIPVAENTGLIYRLSDWVIQNALIQLIEWQKIQPDFSVSINISPVELENDILIEKLTKLVKELDIQYSSLGIEITERGIYENIDKYLNSLQQLREASITLKVDDFGTGSSGLLQLLHFPFQEVKVDKSLIPISPEDLNRIATCEVIFELASKIGFSLIAEGVETSMQKDLLIKIGYRFAQGYFFYRPMDRESLTKLIIQRVTNSEI